MATIYFAGGEDHDFTKAGICSVDTATTAARRTANARCSLKLGPTPGSTDSWSASLTTPQSAFWLTARTYSTYNYSPTDLLTFKDASGIKRLTVTTTSNGLSLVTRNAAGATVTIASNNILPAINTIQKVDVYVNYAASGTFQMYLDGTLVLSYTGNVVTDSATTIAAFGLGAATSANGTSTFWSEVICSDADTRFMSLITLAPVANGNTNNWDVGTVGNINEVTLDDTTVITSGTVGQLAQFTVGSSGVTGNTAIKAVCITARAGKGLTGPQNAKFNVRTGSADYMTAPVALQSGSVARVQGVFMTNPGTGSAWTNADLTAAGFNVGIASDT